METEKTMAVETAETADVKRAKAHKISHAAKKFVGMMTSMAIMVVLGSVQAFAAGGNLSGITNTLTTVVSCIGGGVGVWGIVNLLEGYGSDNPGSKSQGIKQLAAGAGIILVAGVVPGAIGL